MQLSNDTQKVVEILQEISNNSLRKPNDTGSILELGATYGKSELVNNLIFTGKSLWNISAKMKKVNPGQEGIEVLQKEITRLFSEFQSLLAEFKELADVDFNERLDSIYLAQTRGCLKNAIDLSFDLSCLKDLQSAGKRSSK